MRFPRGRRLVGLLSLVALLVIGVGIVGLEPPRPAAEQSTLAGVRAYEVAALARPGIGGVPDGEFAFLAVDSNGDVLVSDRARRSVLLFNTRGSLLKEWGPRFTANVSLMEPAGVAISGDRRYVLDRGLPRILRLDDEGRVQGIISLEALSTYGLNGLAVDLDGNLYVADTGRNRVLVISPTGTLLREIGRTGVRLGELTQPMALAFGPDGSFFIADFENARIQRWDRRFVANSAWSPGYQPYGVAVDVAGRVYVPDAEGRRIQAFTPTGALLGEVSAGSTPTISTVAPTQVGVHGEDPPRLYVLGKDGLLRVELVHGPPPQPAWQGAPLLLGVLAVVILALLLLLARVARGPGRRAR